MSSSGRTTRAPQRPVAVFAIDFAAGSSSGLHRHPFGQLVHAASGTMRVTAERGTWIIPPGRAVWVPAEFEHEVHALNAVAMRTVYLVPEALPNAPRESRVVEVSPLLRELILAALRMPRPYPLGGAEERLFQVLLDRIEFSEVVPLHLPRPASEPLATICRALEADPSDGRPLAAWAARFDTSSRTLARAFVRETRLSFGAWRRQMRLLHSLERLAQGRSVTDVALDLGYESTSAFIHAFRRHLGTTPARYFDPNG